MFQSYFWTKLIKKRRTKYDHFAIKKQNLTILMAATAAV